MIEDYTVIERNEAETVALVEGEPGDALRFATITLANLQAFVVKLAEIATPETEIDLYLDGLTIIGRPVSGDMAKIEAAIDWHRFAREAVDLLQDLGAKYYIKEDLKPFLKQRQLGV